MKQILAKEDVERAMADLSAKGRKTTLAALHAALDHRGSMSTLVRLKAEIEAAAQPVTDSPEGLKAFREVWALAVDEGRKQQDAVLVELRESVKALSTENERLEGTALAAQNHAAEIEQAKSRAETELSRVKTHVEGEMKQAKTALAEATTQAAGALQKLAEAQAAHATQVAALQADLTAAVRKAHELELQLVRAVALLEAKGIQPATAESRKPKHTKETRDQP
jgi:chromosome segregation ATPase